MNVGIGQVWRWYLDSNEERYIHCLLLWFICVDDVGSHEWCVLDLDSDEAGQLKKAYFTPGRYWEGPGPHWKRIA